MELGALVVRVGENAVRVYSITKVYGTKRCYRCSYYETINKTAPEKKPKSITACDSVTTHTIPSITQFTCRCLHEPHAHKVDISCCKEVTKSFSVMTKDQTRQYDFEPGKLQGNAALRVANAVSLHYRTPSTYFHLRGNLTNTFERSVTTPATTGYSFSALFCTTKTRNHTIHFSQRYYIAGKKGCRLERI
ncbi:hypothetical protein Tcan_17476 [Toxocara canis]|uniref:Uncharacterized protein n=1 Tax=Toxocara canis TaxID=6265 RepID=A0A0B2VPV3_TOXCA|nr:hypothetical protein Tcan_17476 [Toxocara canis]